MELEKIVAANLTELRKSKDWTQSELAEKINYSDKTVSKWERSDGLPDLKTICQLARLFGVTVDYFVTENAFASKERFNAPKEEKGYHICISLLIIIGMWAALTTAYVYTLTYRGLNCWMFFVWGAPASCLLMLLLARRFMRTEIKKYELLINSVFCWSLLASVYLQLLKFNIWPVFLIGIPVQTALILWSYVTKKYRS